MFRTVEDHKKCIHDYSAEGPFDWNASVFSKKGYKCRNFVGHW